MENVLINQPIACVAIVYLICQMILKIVCVIYNKSDDDINVLDIREDGR